MGEETKPIETLTIIPGHYTLENLAELIDGMFPGSFVTKTNKAEALLQIEKNHDIKQRQAAQTPNVVFVVASHYQSLPIVVLLLQACLFGIMALSRTLLLQQLQ